jgi:hypothetical protein
MGGTDALLEGVARMTEDSDKWRSTAVENRR